MSARQPRKRTTRAEPVMPTGTYDNRRPAPDMTCMVDGCAATGALYAGGIRCAAHKPNHQMYLAAWLAGSHKKGEAT